MVIKAKVRALRYSFEISVYPETHRNITIGGQADPRIALKWECKQTDYTAAYLPVEAREDSIDIYSEESIYLDLNLPEILHKAVWAAYQEAFRFASKGIARKFSSSATQIAEELESDIKRRLGAKQGGSESIWNAKYREAILADYKRVHSHLKECLRTIKGIKANTTAVLIKKTQKEYPDTPVELIELMAQNQLSLNEIAYQYLAGDYGVKISALKDQLRIARREAKSTG